MSSTESTTDRVIDYLVGAVLLIPKIAVLLWVLLAGGVVPAAITGVTPVPTAEVAVAVEAPEVRSEEIAVEAATEIPPSPTMEPPATGPIVQPPTIDEAGVLDPAEFALDPAGVAGSWAAAQVGGAAFDPAARRPGWPPHLFISFADPDNPTLRSAVAEAVNLDEPQVRIFPAEAYRAMMENAEVPDAGMAFEQMKAFLDEQATGADVTMPTPPLLSDLQQVAISRVTYQSFDGGRGVSYIAHFTANGVGAITNETGFNYVYQGLSEDGEQYILMLWPVEAEFLPGTVADVDDDTLTSVNDDLAGYLAGIQDRTSEAAESNFTPDLSALNNLVSGMSIGAGASALASAAIQEDADDPQLVGTVWQWTEFQDTAEQNDITVDNPESYLLTLWPEGEFSFKADCNVGRGTYELDGASLTFMPGPTTLALCPPDSLDGDFLRLLSGTATYVFDDDGNLVLNLMADAGNMVFADGGPADLADAGQAEEQQDAADAGLTQVALQWSSVTDADGNTTEVPNPENYQVILNDDGTFQVQADCNLGSGVFEYDDADGAVNFTVGPLTRAMCPPDSLSDDFLGYLGAAERVSLAEDGTVTADLSGGGTVTFLVGSAVSAPGEIATTEMAPAEDITGTVWQWTAFRDTAGINDLTVESPENYQLVLWPDGTYSVQADCNFGRGEYEIESSSLSFGPGPFTRALCGPESLGDQYMTYLDNVVSFVLDDDGNLVLNLFADAGNMIFANAGEADVTAAEETDEQPDAADAGLTGVSLLWSTFTNEAGETVEVENPENYQLVLLPDGTYTIQADCNVGFGRYEYNEDGTVTFFLGPLTRALCPPDSLSDEFLSFLDRLDVVSVGSDGNVAATLNDGSTGSFTVGSPVVEELAGLPGGAIEGVTAGQAPDELLNTIWQWTEFQDPSGLNDLTVENPEQYQLLFLPDGRYSFQADCNVGSGQFEIDGSSLTLLPGPMTLAACGPDSLDGQFLQYLGDARTYVFDDEGNLVLNLFADAGNMVFANAGPADELSTSGAEDTAAAQAPEELVNTLWQWTEFQDTAGINDLTVDSPEQYQLLFLPDGSYAFRADCNTGFGQYVVEGQSLTLLPGPMTLVACGPDSLDTQFLQYLGDTVTYVFDDDGNLVLNLMLDAGNMIFGNAGPAEELPAPTAAETEETETAAADPLSGTSWLWVTFRDAKQDYAPPSDQYTIEFLPDGQVAVLADCNNGTGTYAVDNGSINISILAVTAAECGEGSLGTSFVQHLNMAGVYTLQGDTLRIDLMADGGTMTFARLP